MYNTSVDNDYSIREFHIKILSFLNQDFNALSILTFNRAQVIAIAEDVKFFFKVVRQSNIINIALLNGLIKKCEEYIKQYHIMTHDVVHKTLRLLKDTYQFIFDNKQALLMSHQPFILVEKFQPFILEGIDKPLLDKMLTSMRGTQWLNQILLSNVEFGCTLVIKNPLLLTALEPFTIESLYVENNAILNDIVITQYSALLGSVINWKNQFATIRFLTSSNPAIQLLIQHKFWESLSPEILADLYQKSEIFKEYINKEKPLKFTEVIVSLYNDNKAGELIKDQNILAILRHNAAKLNLAQYNIECLLWLVNIDKNIIYFNQKHTELRNRICSSGLFHDFVLSDMTAILLCTDEATICAILQDEKVLGTLLNEEQGKEIINTLATRTYADKIILSFPQLILRLNDPNFEKLLALKEAIIDAKRLTDILKQFEALDKVSYKNFIQKLIASIIDHNNYKVILQIPSILNDIAHQQFISSLEKFSKKLITIVQSSPHLYADILEIIKGKLEVLAADEQCDAFFIRHLELLNLLPIPKLLTLLSKKNNDLNPEAFYKLDLNFRLEIILKILRENTAHNTQEFKWVFAHISLAELRLHLDPKLFQLCITAGYVNFSLKKYINFIAQINIETDEQDEFSTDLDETKVNISGVETKTLLTKQNNLKIISRKDLLDFIIDFLLKNFDKKTFDAVLKEESIRSQLLTAKFYVLRTRLCEIQDGIELLATYPILLQGLNVELIRTVCGAHTALCISTIIKSKAYEKLDLKLLIILAEIERDLTQNTTVADTIINSNFFDDQIKLQFRNLIIPLINESAAAGNEHAILKLARLYILTNQPYDAIDWLMIAAENQYLMRAPLQKDLLLLLNLSQKDQSSEKKATLTSNHFYIEKLIHEVIKIMMNDILAEQKKENESTAELGAKILKFIRTFLFFKGMGWNWTLKIPESTFVSLLFSALQQAFSNINTCLNRVKDLILTPKKIDADIIQQLKVDLKLAKLIIQEICNSDFIKKPDNLIFIISFYCLKTEISVHEAIIDHILFQVDLKYALMPDQKKLEHKILETRNKVIVYTHGLHELEQIYAKSTTNIDTAAADIENAYKCEVHRITNMITRLSEEDEKDTVLYRKNASNLYDKNRFCLLKELEQVIKPLSAKHATISSNNYMGGKENEFKSTAERIDALYKDKKFSYQNRFYGQQVSEEEKNTVEKCWRPFFLSIPSVNQHKKSTKDEIEMLKQRKGEQTNLEFVPKRF